MLNDNLTNNGCSNTSQLEDKVKRLEDVIDGYDQRFNTQDLHTQKLTANNGNIANLESAGIKSDSVDAGALTADSVAVTGSIKAKNFTVEDPVLVNGITSPTASIGTVDATDVNAVNGKITNLTVENLMTGPDSSLEYKNLSVTNQATINKLNLVDPHIAEVIADNAKAVDFEVQNIKQLGDGKITRLDNNSNVISYVDGATILGDVNNDVNIAGKSRPKWNDLSLATLADIQTGGVKPVYRGEVENFSQLPMIGNAKGDLYVVRKLVISDKMGIGHAQWNGESWDPTLIYELELFETAADFEEAVRALTKLIEDNTKAIDEEVLDAINRETAIVDGVKGSRVKKVEEGCTMGDAGNLLATTDDALMLYGAEGRDNIPDSVTSLDDLKTCSQYSISEGKANKYTEKPSGETGAFDLIVGYFNTDKNQPYQIYTSKTSHKVYYRFTTDGVYDEKWIENASTDSIKNKVFYGEPLNGRLLDSLKTPGRYYWTESGMVEGGPPSDAPFAKAYASVTVEAIGPDITNIKQTVYFYVEKTTYERNNAGPGHPWSKWQRTDNKIQAEFLPSDTNLDNMYGREYWGKSYYIDIRDSTPGHVPFGSLDHSGVLKIDYQGPYTCQEYTCDGGHSSQTTWKRYISGSGRVGVWTWMGGAINLSSGDLNDFDVWKLGEYYCEASGNLTHKPADDIVVCQIKVERAGQDKLKQTVTVLQVTGSGFSQVGNTWTRYYYWNGSKLVWSSWSLVAEFGANGSHSAGTYIAKTTYTDGQCLDYATRKTPVHWDASDFLSERGPEWKIGNFADVDIISNTGYKYRVTYLIIEGSSLLPITYAKLLDSCDTDIMKAVGSDEGLNNTSSFLPGVRKILFEAKNTTGYPTGVTAINGTITTVVNTSFRRTATLEGYQILHAGAVIRNGATTTSVPYMWIRNIRKNSSSSSWTTYAWYRVNLTQD